MRLVNLKLDVGLPKVASLWYGFFFRFCTIFVWISIQIPEAVDSLMKHETSARCHASRGLKQSGLNLRYIVYFKSLLVAENGGHFENSKIFQIGSF